MDTRQESNGSEADPTDGLIGHNLYRLRNLRGWSQERLAEAAHVTPNIISMIETGKRVGRIATLVAIAGALGEPIGELFRANSMTVPSELASFLETPMARGVTDEEVVLLRHMTVPGRKMTPESYYLALQLVRSTEPAE